MFTLFLSLIYAFSQMLLENKKSRDESPAFFVYITKIIRDGYSYNLVPVVPSGEQHQQLQP